MIIEALLFSSDKPLTVKEIHDVLPDAEKSEIRNSIKVLTHDYDTLERSFVLKEVAGGYQFRSRPEYGSYILRMFQKTPNRLSKATIETLAIIAYKQPIMRSEIERLRGVDVGGIVRTLMEKGLIKIMGRKELPGRPLIYGTTKRFLEVFDLKDLKSLPKLKEIKDFAADQYEPTTVNRDVSESDINTENTEIPEPETETDRKDADIPEPPEDTSEEDETIKTQNAPAPEDIDEPEENGTET
jgi:segregation and condensation protein B